MVSPNVWGAVVRATHRMRFSFRETRKSVALAIRVSVRWDLQYRVGINRPLRLTRCDGSTGPTTGRETVPPDC